MKEIEKKRNEGIEEFDNNDLLTVINHQSIEQLCKMQQDFYKNFQAFKENLENKEDQNFKYLRCRLDFNMYY